MRISTDENDTAFRVWMRGASGSGLIDGVTVDGHAVRDIVTADEEAGYVERHVRFPDGEFAVDPNTQEINRERLYGHVRILWTERGRAMLAADKDGTLRGMPN